MLAQYAPLFPSQSLNNSFKRYLIRAANPVHQPIASEANRLTPLESFDRHPLRRTVLDEEESGHSRDVEPAGDVLDVVDVDLGERKLALCGVLVSQLGEDGRDGATGRAPVRVEVDYDVGCGRCESIEFGG